MAYSVRYRCPHCDLVVEVERSGYLADRSVTPFPLEVWTYRTPEEVDNRATGIRFICGETHEENEGCGKPWYLSFVRYENGKQVEVPKEPEYVRINTGPQSPRWPRGPSL